VPAVGGRGFVEKKINRKERIARKEKTVILRGAKRRRRIHKTGRDKSRPYTISSTPLPLAKEGGFSFAPSRLRAFA